MTLAPLRNAALAAARAAGGFALARRLTARSLRVLGYHGIWIEPGQPYGECLFMVPEQFEARMRRLVSSGVPVLGLDEAIELLAQDRLPPHATVITIDDGWRTTYTHMLPLLETLRLPATLYLSTWYVENRAPVVNVALGYVLARCQAPSLSIGDLLPGLDAPLDLTNPAARRSAVQCATVAISSLGGLEARVAALVGIAERADVPFDPAGDQFRYMTGADVRDAARRGLSIELHGHRHRSATLPGVDLATEIVDNRAALARVGLPTEPQHFCYPLGHCDAAAEDSLAALGLRSATTTRRGLNPPGSRPLALARFLDGPRVAQVQFDAWHAGMFAPLDG